MPRKSGHMTAERNIWLSGPVHGIPPLLVPVAHSLLQAREDAHRAVSGVRQDLLWVRPGGAASAGFHLFHAAHALDRLMTCARGESLQNAQRRALLLEQSPDLDVDRGFLLELFGLIIDRALLQLRCTSEASLLKDRVVGSKCLPSNVLGLLYHAAEHTTRHVGQLITTLKIVQRERSGAPT